MNTYAKFCPNVFLAQCSQEYKKGEIIQVKTKYGKINDCIVHNLILTKNGLFYYSITRSDGFNTQERALAKASRYTSYAANAEKRSNEYFEAAQEGKDFLSLGEPIKIGHHSEKKHRALIERNNNRMSKCVAESEKVEGYEDKAAYWESKAKDINLSMPESLEYYAFKVEKAKEYHEGLKSEKYPKEHAFSLQYANKAVKDLTKNLELAIRLWA